MIRKELATEYQKGAFPWVYDRIEVTGRTFTGPAKASHMMADFDRPSEPVRFSLLGTYHCEYPSGPNLAWLADEVGKILGAGFYGMQSGRRIYP